MQMPRVRFTVRGTMVAVLGVAMLMGWVSWLDDARVAGREAEAAAIRADEWGRYDSRTEAVKAARIARVKARRWAEGGPGVAAIFLGSVLIVGALSLSRSIGKAASMNRHAR